MGGAVDISQDFKECVRAAAIKHGMDQAKLVKLSNSLIMPKVTEQSPFMKAAIETMKSINTLHDFVLTRRKDYTDRHRSTEQDRDSIEHEVGMFVKTCRERIDLLKNTIGKVEASSQSRWLAGLVGSTSNADLVAHQHGVVLILSERLHSVTALFDRFRATRFQEAMEKNVPRWRTSASSGAVTQQPANMWDGHEETSRPEATPLQQSARQDLLDEETHALQVELTNLLESAQGTERKMIEMSALNHVFSTHVLHQAQQIEMLYQQALDATENVEKGNKEMRKAIERSKSSQTFLLLFLFVLPLALLFLHWYN